LARLLERFGFRTREATTVAEARRLAADEPPDVLVSDLELPDGDGCDLARRLLATHPGLYAIALSGYDSDADRERCRLAGFQLLLAKSLVFQQLLDALESCPARDIARRSLTITTSEIPE
jgi:CheY-like chemotaxis protein